MALKLFYITNNLDVAKIAEMYGVDRIWIDLETLGKEERQKNLNTVKSHHSISDIIRIKPQLKYAEMLVRVNPWNENSVKEIDAVIEAGADIVMLPMWKSVEEVQSFISAVYGRCKTTLLLETKEAVECLDDVLELDFDEIHIGLNDLHISYGLTFMFELLSNGTVEMLCNKFKAKGVPFGFGGIAKIGDGLLPAEKIIMEHYRIGSTRAILSRTFCSNVVTDSLDEIERMFSYNMKVLRDYEFSMKNKSAFDYEENKKDVAVCVQEVVEMIKRNKSNG